MSGLLTSHGIIDVFHYVPLHYLVFILRSKCLLSKNALRRTGYIDSHFRRTSRRQDELRGFSSYVHLTLDHLPPILRAKLTHGFPHFEVRVPAEQIEKGIIHLCRFNIAKTRYLQRPGSRGSSAGVANGRYHGVKQIPTAETNEECEALLKANLGRNMIEVLVPDRVGLSDRTALIFFNESDSELAADLVRSMDVGWQVKVAPHLSYTAQPRYVNAVKEFLEQSIANPNWRGDGLDFDYV